TTFSQVISRSAKPSRGCFPSSTTKPCVLYFSCVRIDGPAPFPARKNTGVARVGSLLDLLTPLVNGGLHELENGRYGRNCVCRPGADRRQHGGRAEPLFRSHQPGARPVL